MPKLLILTQSEFFNDPRVLKESTFAQKHNYDTTVYCYTSSDKSEIYEGVSIIRVKYMLYNTRELFRKIFLKKLQPIEQPDMTTEQPLTKTPREKPFEQTFRVVLNNLAQYIFSNIHLFIRARTENPDIVHATDLPTLLCGVLLKYKTGAKLVYDTHELWIESLEYSPNWIKYITRVYEYFLIQHCDAVVTVNKSIADILAKRYSIQTPVVVLNTPYLVDIPPPTFDVHDVRVIYQGRYTRGRGLEELIDSTRFLPPNVHMYFRGYDGYGGHNYEDTLRIRANGRVTFLQPVDMVDLVKELHGFHIGVVPYIATNMNNYLATPNKLFEYMSAGLPVAVSDYPELRRLSAGCGTTFNPKDPEDISKAIVRTISSYKTHSYNAQKFTKDEYNWEIQGKKLLNTYNTTICS